MKAGFYEADITPAFGSEIPGDYYKCFVRQVHDPLKVRAAVLGEGDDRVALVGVDAGSLPSGEWTMAVRREVEARTGIKANRILIAASHTHCGGAIEGPAPDDFKDAPELVSGLLSKYTICADSAYRDWVKSQLWSAIALADQTSQEAILSVGSGAEGNVTHNRRHRWRDGRTYSMSSPNHPDNLGPAGPIDPEVGVLAAWSTQGDLLGCIVNFACHGTTFGGPYHGIVSADWVYYLESTITGSLGSSAAVVFLNGACGDVTQARAPYGPAPGASEMARRELPSRFVGQSVGSEAVRVMLKAPRGDLAPLSATSTVLRLKRRLPSEQRLAECRKLVEEGLRAGTTDTTEWIMAKELLVLDYLAKKEPESAVEVQAIQVGPAVFVANPAEYFCHLGLDIKQASPFPFTYVVELANGCVGYTPTEDAFLPSGGGYETALTSYSSLEITAGRKIADAGIALARSLTPGSIPDRPVPPLRGPAGYGALGPDL